MSDEFPPLAPLPQLTLHPSTDPSQIDAPKMVNAWLTTLTTALTANQPIILTTHFLPDHSWWRDLATFTWDIACHNGSEAISKYLRSSTSGFTEAVADLPGALAPHLEDMGGMKFIQSGFRFKTRVGKGRGVVRLANVGPEEWRAWTVYTVLERLDGQDEVEARREKEQSTLSSSSGAVLASTRGEGDVQVLVIGVDKTSRVGDSWRNRYETIKLHTPSYTDHYAFLKFPTNWPRYPNQDQIANWMEHYAAIMELKIQHDTEAKKIAYDESTKKYLFELKGKDGITWTITAKHAVLASGLFNDNIPVRPTFAGEDSFKGEIYHTTAHKSARFVPELQGKKVTIIGAGTSAHDIAQDFVKHGAKSVTLVQRGEIYVASLGALEEVSLKVWNTPGVSTEDADLLGSSFPWPVVRTLSVGASQMMAAIDKDMLDGLEKAGVALKRGDKGDSLVDHQFIKGGHSYLDQGACQMIIDGRIKVRRCEKGVQGYYPEGIILADGTKVESDLVILATGIERGEKVVEQIMGKDVVDKVGGLFGLDEAQERIGTWRPTGVAGFWFTAGSFAFSRQYAPTLALQIAAAEWGLSDKRE
ncbi:Pc17g00640 [Penicillium rubens Wisconsin 54-1255]|uniref:Pc17g00640 protein n=1 Tax=Penicillium rubens (strain ATCC 28089 / DSM 1075 / NRRL 1951 / Wisconsin 54-1255) TaxID=500485 RepID=B6HAY7_PENRW|nr:Pc17g00640 [Penicillium rubens Wisconsin 54-1255]